MSDKATVYYHHQFLRAAIPYRLPLEHLPICRNTPQPTPAGKHPAWGVEQMEVVPVANPCDLAQQASATKEVGVDVIGSWYPAQVRPVEMQRPYHRGYE